MKRLSTLVALLLFTIVIYAQDTTTVSKFELKVNIGMLSEDQFMGIFAGPTVGYMDMPSRMTTAVFVSGLYHFTPHSSIGITAGADNQWGNISYGNSKNGPYGNSMTTRSGIYIRQAYTMAAEYKYFYAERENKGRRGYHYLYGFMGVGYTYGVNKYIFEKDAYMPQYLYGPLGLVATNPYTEHYFHFNAQITPIGICTDRKFGGFIEFGYGYKGMISCGLLLRL